MDKQLDKIGEGLEHWDGKTALPEGYSSCAILLGRYLPNGGDDKYMWDRGNPVSVEAARRHFDYMTRELRYAAFSIDPARPLEKGERMQTFQPDAQKVMFVPPLAGG